MSAFGELNCWQQNLLVDVGWLTRSFPSFRDPTFVCSFHPTVFPLKIDAKEDIALNYKWIGTETLSIHSRFAEWNFPENWFERQYRWNISIPSQRIMSADCLCGRDRTAMHATSVSCNFHLLMPYIIFTVSDFTETLAQLYEKHAEELQVLVSNYRKKNGELRKEVNWERLMQIAADKVETYILKTFCSVRRASRACSTLGKRFCRRLKLIRNQQVNFQTCCRSR